MSQAINIVLDGPPEDGKFIDIETDDGRSINIGEWRQSDNKYWWVLRIDKLPE